MPTDDAGGEREAANPPDVDVDVDPQFRRAVIALAIAAAVSIALNIGASFLPYWTMEGALLWAAATFGFGMFAIWFVPGGWLPAIYALTFGAWVIAFRFTGDIGPSAHFSGGFLMAALLAFSICLGFKSHSCANKADRETS